jgi:transposase
MRKRRTFGAEFKTGVVLQVVSGEKSLAEVCREDQLTAQMVGNWKQQFLTHASRVFEDETANSTEAARIANLEQMVGKLTMQLEIAKKLPLLPVHWRAETDGSHATTKRRVSRPDHLRGIRAAAQQFLPSSESG